MKKKVVIFMVIIIVVMASKNIYAKDTSGGNETNEINTDEILSEEISSFGINSFLKEAEKYMPNTFENMNLNDIFQNALQGKVDNKTIFTKILNLFGIEIKDTIKILINILVIILIHSILKSITDGLENSEISKMVYYVQYILIVTIIITSFVNILKSVNETIENLVGFAQNLIPILITLMTYTGSITVVSIAEPILLFLIEFISNIIKNLIMPIMSIIMVIIIVSKITDKIQISNLGKFLKSSVVWFLGIILTIFVGVLSLEGSLTSSVDGITAKTAKATVSSLIPVVRKNIRR